MPVESRAVPDCPLFRSRIRRRWPLTAKPERLGRPAPVLPRL